MPIWSANTFRHRNGEIRLGFIAFVGFIDLNYSGTSTVKSKCVVQNFLQLDDLRTLFTGENHVTIVAPQGKTSINNCLPQQDCKKHMKKVLHTIVIALQSL